jgi:hypothetical protein
MTYEISRGQELASANELLELHTLTTHWLAVHGKKFVELQDVNSVSEYDGLPISDNYPRLQAPISGSAIKAILPEPAEVLGITGGIEPVYFFPHYQPLASGGLFYEPPASNIYIPAADDDTVYPGGRVFRADYNPELGSCLGSKRMMDDTLERNLDSRDEPITKRECEALVDIMSNLDVIQRYAKFSLG